MARRIREHDWSATPLGPIARWPLSLRLALSTVLDNPLPVVLVWGPEFTSLYNDAYLPLLGGKPDALGRSFLEIWGEARSTIAPQMERARAGEACRFEGARFELLRGDKPAEAFFDHSFSPVRDETGAVAGVMNIAVETNARMLNAGSDVTERQRSLEHLNESEERLRTVLEGIGEQFYVLDPGWRFLFVSRSALEVWGKRHEDVLGHFFLDSFPQAESSDAYEAHRRVMRSGVTERFETISPVLDRWIEVDIAPTRQGGLSVAFRDIDDRKRAEEKLRQRELNTKFLDQIGQDLAKLSSPDDILKTVGAKVGEYLGLSGCIFCDVDEAQDQVTVHHGWTADQIPKLKQLFRLRDYLSPEFARASRAGENFIVRDTATDPRTSRYDYALLQVGAFVVIPYFRGDRWVACFAVASVEPREWRQDDIDLLKEISDRLFARKERAQTEIALRANESTMRLLLDELQHRVRNILATVRAIANRTARIHDTLEDFQAHFDGRLSALARTQNVLTRSPGAGVDLENLIREELLAQAATEQQFSLAGPSFHLAPKAAEVVTLAIHELATNATKYGALAAPHGHIAIDWDKVARENEDWLSLRWIESGVSMPKARPALVGFGTELITRRIPHELHGKGSISFEADGVHAEISFPLRDGQSTLETGFTPYRTPAGEPP